MRKLLFLLFLLAAPSWAADIYWVDDNGAATWANAESDTPLSGASACSLATANANADAGDTVYLRAGTYSTGIVPTNSGTSGNEILWEAYDGESVIIATSGRAGVELDGVSYQIIDDIEVDGANSPTFLMEITGGSDYNIIRNCYMYNDTNGVSAIIIRTNNVTEGVDDNNHNWIYDNVFEKGGVLGPEPDCDDKGGLFDVGSDNAADSFSGNNTIENNVFITGAHHVVKTKSKKNLIRNNVISNPENYFAEGSCTNPTDSGFYGNRGLTVLDHAQFSDGYNVVEGNRIGHAGIPSDGQGGFAMTIGASKTLVRYNEFYGTAETGVYFRSSSNNADDIAFYNNTIWKNGLIVSRAPPTYPGITYHGVRVQLNSDNNHIVNCIIHDNNDEDISDETSGTLTTRGNWLTADGDPGFTDETWPGLDAALSTTEPNLRPTSESGAIDNGSYLTQADGSGSGSTSLTVDNSYFFQDGTVGSSLSNVQPDVIAIGTVDNTAEISSIDYATHTITLASAMTWSNNDDIWLYSKSDGERVLYGSAPDQGAFEYQAAAAGSAYTGQLRLNSGGAKPSLGGGARFKLN